MTTALNFLDIANAVASTGPDMTKEQKGGGGTYVPPAAGTTRLRFIAYIEVGQHMKKGVKGAADKPQDQVILGFELSGPKHPPTVKEDGTKVPHRIFTRPLNLSRNEKAAFFKLFKRMNYKGAATHMSQLLGQAFLGTVYVNESGEGDAKRVYANLDTIEDGFSVRPPRVEDLDGNVIEVPVDEPLSPIRMFVWNAKPEHLKPLWDTIFIDGSYGEGDKAVSANRYQLKIQDALNYKDSPIAQALSGGDTLDLPDTPAPVTASATDPLDGVA